MEGQAEFIAATKLETERLLPELKVMVIISAASASSILIKFLSVIIRNLLNFC